MNRNLGLSVRDLTVRFGGLVAVSGVSLEAPLGRITGLIGPNGAGKTTIFNACSGLVQQSAGRIEFAGLDISHMGPAARATLGLGRTFQRLETWDRLTVQENVRLGREAAIAHRRPLVGQLFATPGERQETDRAADEAMMVCGIVPLADCPVGSLSTGQKRLVELARVLAGPFRLLLLDEPSSGLDSKESEQFGRILQRLVAERGVGILLVEHDMALVSRVCEYVHVIDFGRPLFEGTMDEVLRSDTVVTAYLGSDADTVIAQREREQEAIVGV